MTTLMGTFTPWAIKGATFLFVITLLLINVSQLQ